MGESSIGLVARSGRAGEGLRWVVRLPGWLRVGLLADAEAVRRITAFTLYCLFVPLAFLAPENRTSRPIAMAIAVRTFCMFIGILLLCFPGCRECSMNSRPRAPYRT